MVQQAFTICIPLAMKKLTILTALILAGISVSAQRLNDKGLYVSSDGELFTGKITAYKNDVKSELSVREGIISGEANYFYASGKIMETGIFSEGKKDQKWVRYNENGTIGAVAFYALGKKTGTWLVFDNEGKKRFEMHYTNGEKSGTWTNWDENGKIVSTKDYSITN